MQQQQQQQGGSQFGAPSPDMAPFTAAGSEPRSQMVGIASGADHRLNPPTLAEAASPISSRPPPLAPSRQNLDELVSAAARGSFPDDDAGEEVERGGAPGNRWPRQETLALLKIRSDMDAAFRDATLKGPLWEDVSRKLAELGFMRSAKKCKEKFENVQKYYKRTKEGRAGRQDGKSYRFFSQLEALHSGSTGTGTAPLTPTNTTMASPTATLPLAPVPTANPTPTPVGFSSSSTPGPSFARVSPPPVPAPTPTPTPTVTTAPTIPAISASATAAAAAGISFSSDRFSTSSSDQSDDEGTEEGDVSRETRKRKRGGESRGGSKKMMAFFEGLMKQLMERQEAMQQRFLDTIEKREQDRMIREEAWKRQEMARLNREHELLAQERAVAATRDAAVISFLQKISGQAIQLPPAITVPVAPPPQASPPPPPQPQQQQPPPAPPLQPQAPQPPPQPQPQELHLPHQSTEIVRHQASSSSTELVPVPEPHEGVVSGTFEGASPSSRWPKSEVHALIKIRSGLEGRYQEAGPKGPLWEEISQGMQRIGYNRSAKRCKEKWENINKYFKKVKESNKKRPEDAKTCPYFHQLDALYRSKLHGSSTSSGMGFLRNQPQQQEQEPNSNPNPNPNPNPQERNDILVSIAPPPAPETAGKNGNNNRNGGNTEGGGIQIPTTNGGLPPSFLEEGTSGGTTMKKPEDIVKELMERQHQQAAMDDYDSELDEDDDEDDEDRKMQYEIQFQRQNVGGGGGGNASTKSAATAVASAAGSFLAMVQ